MIDTVFDGYGRAAVVLREHGQTWAFGFWLADATQASLMLAEATSKRTSGLNWKQCAAVVAVMRKMHQTTKL